VKHLLSGLPNVAERVKAMRQSKNANAAEDNKNRMFASQEAYIKVGWEPASLVFQEHSCSGPTC
jgi:hypothetical protein